MFSSICFGHLFFPQENSVKHTFYDNRTNSRAHWLIFIVNSIQFNFYLTYTEYYVHKVRMILQYYLTKIEEEKEV